MTKRIVIIQGHPDPDRGHFGHALAKAYAEGAAEAGFEVRTIAVAELDFPLLRTQDDWQSAAPQPAILQAQQSITWAQHVVIFYPLWLGAMPALLKGFLEQLFRPGFAFPRTGTGGGHKSLLRGRSARIVVTMGMPAVLYRWYFGAHGLKNLERNILGFVGFSPVRDSLIGLIESPTPARRTRWLEKMRKLGAAGR